MTSSFDRVVSFVKLVFILVPSYLLWYAPKDMTSWSIKWMQTLETGFKSQLRHKIPTDFFTSAYALMGRVTGGIAELHTS